MTAFTIFLGDTGLEVAEAAKQHNNNAILLDYRNWQTVIGNKNPNTVYTALGDLPNDVPTIYRILDSADHIVYCPPQQWSDNKTFDPYNVRDSLQGNTEWFLFLINSYKHNVSNFDLSHVYCSQALELRQRRQSHNQQLWIAGCSISHGMGVESTQRYGEILARQLNLPVCFLTTPGASIPWVADQILRSDIRTDDIVVWGLTEENRFCYWQLDNTPAHITSTHRKRPAKINLSPTILDKLLTDGNCFYQALNHVHQVVNYCKKLQANLLLVGILESPTLALNLATLSSYTHYHNPATYTTYNRTKNFIDLGSDQSHPGPQQHQHYADFCIKELSRRQYI